MSITGQNSIINQFVPRFVLKSVTDGQILVWDNIAGAFVNKQIVAAQGGLTADQLNQFQMLTLYYLQSGATFAAPVFDFVATQTSPDHFSVVITSTTPGATGTINWGDTGPTSFAAFSVYKNITFTHVYSIHTSVNISVTLTNVYGTTTVTHAVTPT